jgi:HSP20 family molecular chaperone IbpA/predicted Rdx family selenoprotein
MTKGDREYKIYCDVPGVSKSDLRVEVNAESPYQKTLSISGIRKFGDRDTSSYERGGNVSVERGSEQIGSSSSSSQPYQGSQIGYPQGNQQQHGSLQSSQLAFPGSTQQSVGTSQPGVVSVNTTNQPQSSNLGIERSGRMENVGTTSSTSSTVPSSQLGSNDLGVQRGTNVSSERVEDQPHEKTLGEKIRDVVDPTRWGSSNTSSTHTTSTSDSTSTTGLSNPNNDQSGYGRQGYGMSKDNERPVDNRTTGQKIRDVVDPTRWGKDPNDRSSVFDRNSYGYDRSGYGYDKNQQWGSRGMGMGMDNEIQFSRTINLPSDADEKNIRAKLENGVLCLCMPRLQGRSNLQSINVD